MPGGYSFTLKLDREVLIEKETSSYDCLQVLIRCSIESSTISQRLALQFDFQFVWHFAKMIFLCFLLRVVHIFLTAFFHCLSIPSRVEVPWTIRQKHSQHMTQSSWWINTSTFSPSWVRKMWDVCSTASPWGLPLN